MRYDKTCWACSLGRGDIIEHKTHWYYRGPEGVVAVDMNSDGHFHRLLFVPPEHVPCGQETEEMIAAATRLLYGVGRAVALELGLKITKLDLHNHRYDRHWHAQLALDRRAK